MNTYIVIDAISKSLVRAENEDRALEIVGETVGYVTCKQLVPGSSLKTEMWL